MTTTSQNSMLIAVFSGLDQANQAIDNPEQALSILRQSGAYDIAFRMRNAQPQQPMTQENYNPNIQQGTNNPNPAPAGYEPHTQQGTNNPNVAQGTNNPNAQPGNYDTQ